MEMAADETRGREWIKPLSLSVIKIKLISTWIISNEYINRSKNERLIRWIEYKGISRKGLGWEIDNNDWSF